MRSTLLTRILISTLAPVLFVFVIVTATIQSIITISDASRMQDSASLAAEQMTYQIQDKLDTLEVFLSDISSGMESLRFDQPEGMQGADALLRTLFTSSDVHCAWFVFEPGVFPVEGRYCRSLVQSENGVRDGYTLMSGVLDNPADSQWYWEPLVTGQLHPTMEGLYDYGFEDSAEYILILSQPVWVDGRVVGVVGIDVRYETLLEPTVRTAATALKTMMMDATGTILYSKNEDEIGSSLFGYSLPAPGAMQLAMSKNEIWVDEVISPFLKEKAIVTLYPMRLRDKLPPVYLYRSTPPVTEYSIFYPSMEIIFITCTLGAMLLGFSVYFTARGVVRPIKRLSENFRLVADSGADADTRIPVESTKIKEIEVLQETLATMMMHLGEVHNLKIKSMEADIERETLIAASQAKTNFFATMSHEIRTPMNAIHGITEIILHEDGLTSRQHKQIEDIKTSSEALLGIINDIMDISKMETGKMRLYPEHYHFRGLLDNINSLANYLAAEAGLAYRPIMDGTLPVCLFGDGARLRQVLLNLLGNAVKYTAQGHISMHAYVHGGLLYFDISDTGIGIPENEVDFIFESFNRIDTRRNREVTGTGLGLSIAKSLTELMGGRVTVVSEYGVGSTFSVVVPFVLGNESRLHREIVPPGERRYENLHVLIVDDNEINLSVSSGLLRTLHGIAADTVASGAEAIQRIQESIYDMIFMDHMMPDLDGVDTTRLIRALGGVYESIPIIALTANAVLGTKEALIASGMDDFLSKPIQRDRLAEVLHTWAPVGGSSPTAAMRTQATPRMDMEEAQAAQQEHPLVRAMASVPEIDTKTGLAQIGGDGTMYLHSLRLLESRLPDTLRTLTSLLMEENLTRFRVCIHGLKGSLRSIGAEALSSQAQILEIAAGQNRLDECREKLSPLVEALASLHKRLTVALAEADAFVTPAIAPVVTQDGSELNLLEFCSILESCDYEAVTNGFGVLEAHLWADDAADTLLRVRGLIDSFDYFSAKALIESELIGRKAQP